VTLFLVNRHPSEPLPVDIALGGFAARAIADYITIAHDDLRAINTAGDERVAPRKGKGAALSDGSLAAALPPLSYHVIRVEV
jgi:alpha-N-arabinofuranosidase